MAINQVTASQAAQVGESLLRENADLSAQNEKLQVKIEKLEGQLSDLVEKYKKLREFEPMLDDTPSVYMAYLTDPNVVRKIQAAALKVYGSKEGRHPDEIQENERLRRRARLNWETIINAGLKYALGPAWNKVYNSYIKPLKV